MARPKRTKATGKTKAVVIATETASTSDSPHPAPADLQNDHSTNPSTAVSKPANSLNARYTMSGAMPSEAPPKISKRAQILRNARKKNLSRLAKEDENTARLLNDLRERMEADQAKSSATKSRRKQPDTSLAAEPAQAVATLQVQRSQPEEEPEEDCNDDDGPATDAPGSAWKRQSTVPMSVRKPISTPRAEASMLALANFKRRSRAPSILGIGNDDDDTASISSDGTFGDLSVDDESTPLPRTRNNIIRPDSILPARIENTEPRTTSSKKRKRGSEELRVPDSQPKEANDVRSRKPSLQAAIEIPSPHSSTPLSEVETSLPELPAVEDERQSLHTPSSTMAPPESSSPLEPDSPLQKKHGSSPLQSRSTKKKPRLEQGIAKGWGRDRAAKNQGKNLDTAALQGLLPKRKHHERSNEFSIWDSDDSGPGSNDDELSFAPTKRSSNNRGRAALKLNSTSRQTKPPKKTGKSIKAAATPEKSTRTYSRRQSGKENLVVASDEDQPAGGSDSDGANVELAHAVSSNRSGSELKDIARKFAEVDAWDMEFEEVTGSSDTFKNAR